MTKTTNEPSKARVIFLAALGAMPPLSTDMYLVAIPHLSEIWSAPTNIINLSLVLWFVAFSISLLVFGSLSDRWGRRPIMLGGLALFAIASALCATATGPMQLIFFRVLQGIAAAAPSSMTMAYCRDSYEGHARQKLLAWLGIIIMVAPMAAPSVGAYIMHYAPWQTIFVLLAIYSGSMLALSWFLFEESSATKEPGGAIKALNRYVRLARNRNFLLANFSMSLIAAPVLGYVGIASLVYMEHFHLSETTFALLFAAVPLSSMVGAFVCTRMLRIFSDRSLIMYSLIGSVFASIILLSIGALHVVAFVVGMCVFGFFTGVSRPLANHLVLEQVDRDIGAASSTIIFTQFMAGAICMAYTTAGWAHPIAALGFLVLLVPGLVLLSWPFIQRKLQFTPAQTTA
ncbi:multidrug effflux MFS transporter [Cerasicoccus fimbriatus]|uniref:multidrug effflux MFS transporter n=1 Tax=Cerasicoccus fimbriatus TaxID=3014554 RepID=UPI0022B5C6CC|nr:multidrug effflux MFS transporter [Cerasicoccus sp. TK19100]